MENAGYIIVLVLAAGTFALWLATAVSDFVVWVAPAAVAAIADFLDYFWGEIE